MWRVVDRWQTQNGSWDVDANSEFGIDQAHRDFYLQGRDIPGAGGDHHIFIKAKPGMRVSFRSEPQGEPVVYTVPQSGWVNHPMFGEGSTYYPKEGERGPWIVAIDGIDVMDGIGLPEGKHVSTFLVAANSRGEQPPLPGEPEPPKEPGEWKRERVVMKVGDTTFVWEAMVQRG